MCVKFLVNLIYILTLFFDLILAEDRSLLSSQREIIFNYFELNNIETIAITACWSPKFKAQVLSEGSERGFRISFSFDSMEPWPSLRRGGVLDLNCPEAEQYLEKISQEKMFGIHTEWLLIDLVTEKEVNITEDGAFLSSGVRLASEPYALPGSCVRLVQIIAETRTVYYFNIHRITVREEMKFQLDWHGTIDETPTEFTWCSYLNRSNFGGAFLNAVIVVEFPKLFQGFDSMYHMDVDIWPKTHYPISVLFSEQLNFRFNFTLVHSYGWLDDDSNFDGMIGLLQREEVEISATGGFMRGDRMNAVQFAAETFEPRTAVLFKQPPLSSANNIFILPFSQLVWIACGVLSLFVILLLILEFIVSRYRSIQPYEQQNVDIPDLVTMVISTVCQQGTELVPITVPARITVFLFSLAAFFLYTSYSANIVALLQSTAPVLKSLNDITNSHLAFKVQDLRYNRKFFKESTDPSVINLYNKKVKPIGDTAYCLPEEGIRLMRTGKYAFSVEANVGFKIISDTFGETEKCRLGVLKIFFSPKLGIPVVKKSGHREHITRMMAWQREVGLLKRIALYWLPSKPNCEGQTSDFMSVGVTDFLPAIMVYIYGVAIVVFLFLLELTLHYSNKMREKRKTRIKNIQIIPSFQN